MKRVWVCLMVVGAVFGVSAASAVAATAPNEIEGTYMFHESGYRVTVGFAACGHEYDFGGTTYLDPLAQYVATVKKGGGWATTIWAHNPDRLNDSLMSFYGFGLTDQARATLEVDATTYACTG